MDDQNSNNQDNPTAPANTGGSSSTDGIKVPVNTSAHAKTEGIAPSAPGQVVSAGMAQPAQAARSDGSTPNPQAPQPLRPDSPVESPPLQVVTSSHGRGKRWLKAFLLLVIIALLAVGGWFAYQKNRKDKPAPATSQSKDIPLLKVGILQANYGDTLYPDMSLNEYSYLTNSQMFEGLVRYEDKNKIVPVLASTWTNPDAKTWLFTLRKDVKFHDGNTLEAADVKYSLDKVIASNSDLAQTFASSIATVEVVNNNQVKITTKDPDPALLNRLAFLYVIDDKLPEGAAASQAGTGPYMVKPGTKPSDSGVQMVAFDKYHGGKPKTRALDFSSSEDADKLVTDFNARKFNIIGPVPVNDVSKAKKANKFVSIEPNTFFLGFNTVKPGPLQNKQVREAIRYAVSPTAIGKAAGNQVTPLSQLIPESIPGYNPAITPYKQDINKAKQLLAQAGYANGLTIRYSTSADPDKVNEIVNELKQVGITVQVDRHDNFDEFIDYFSTGKAEMYSVDYASDTLDGLDIYTTTLNEANYSNPELTKLLNEASTTTDAAKRLKLLQEAGNIINQDVAVVPLSTQNDIWLMDKDYAIQQDMPSAMISVYFSDVRLK